MKIDWAPGFSIETRFARNEFVMEANKEGLLSLAAIFEAIAHNGMVDGYVLHLDDSNSLEEGSVHLVISKKSS